MLKTGQLRRIRRGWYQTPEANPEAIRAIKLGGRLCCLSECKRQGLWVPPGDIRPHIALPSHAENDLPSDVVGHRSKLNPGQPTVPLRESLGMVLRHHDAETGLIVLESAVDKGLITRWQARELIAEQSGRKQQELRFFTPGAQSGSETRARLFLQRRGLDVKIQQHPAGVGRVDILVGKSLIIECDSAAHHSKVEDYLNDRERDLQAIDAGYSVIRLSYPQIWSEWKRTQQVLIRRLGGKRYRSDSVHNSGDFEQKRAF